MLDAMSWGPDATFDLADAVATVRSFGSLTEDWDGSGGVPFDPRTLRHAEAILTTLAKWVSVPAVYPESNGTVTLDWVADDYQCLIEVGLTRFSAFIRRGPNVLYQNQGLVEVGFPEAFVQLAQAMQNYPVGARWPWRDAAVASALAWTDLLLDPARDVAAWVPEEPMGASPFQAWLATLIPMSSALRAW